MAKKKKKHQTRHNKQGGVVRDGEVHRTIWLLVTSIRSRGTSRRRTSAVASAFARGRRPS